MYVQFIHAAANSTGESTIALSASPIDDFSETSEWARERSNIEKPGKADFNQFDV
jgi:hypothetical protein